MTDFAPPPRVLLVDDDPGVLEMLKINLGGQGFEIAAEGSPADALERLALEDFDVVVSDVNMPEIDGLTLTQHVLDQKDDMPVILITGAASLELAVSALRLGAWDLLPKPIDLERLGVSIQRACAHRALQTEVKRLRRLVPSALSDKVIGKSVQMRKVYDLVQRVAQGEAAVLITGESGTGKELVAHAIHECSGRKAGPFVAINCAAVPASLLESELFGHTRGAFTDAKGDRKGLFVEAEGGTLFLDEITELPLDMQPKLLRALQERRVRPLGGTAEVPFNARLVTATNRDLETEVSANRFRQDLFYRINVVKIDVPPLRERPGDCLVLAQHFIDLACPGAGKTLSPEAARLMLVYDWRGNVRELENCVESAVALSGSSMISADDLPARVRHFRSRGAVVEADTARDLVTLAELENRYLRRLLPLVAHNKTRAAQILGVDRRTLYRMLERNSLVS